MRCILGQLKHVLSTLETSCMSIFIIATLNKKSEKLLIGSTRCKAQPNSGTLFSISVHEKFFDP